MAEEKANPEMWKTALTIILLILFWPVGVILMFVWMKWPAWLKILLVVLPILLIGVLAVLVAVTLVAINPAAQIKKAEETKMRYDLSATQRAVTSYYLDKLAFPRTLGDLVPEYLAEVPGGAGYVLTYKVAPDNYEICARPDAGAAVFTACIDKSGVVDGLPAMVR